MDFSTLGNLGNTFFGAYDKAKEQRVLGRLGEGIRNGTLDYNAAAGDLFGLGKADMAIGVMKLGETARQRAAGQEASAALSRALSGSDTAASQGGLEPSAAPASLIQNESGGNWQAENNAVGAGGQRGHFGRLQFGHARLQEAAAAGAIPQGTSPQAFMSSPELQQRAEAWHFNDIDNHIRQAGLDRAVGQTINGVPVTVEGMRAVAHLGGKEGLSRFIQSGGRYDPADENGTRLSDYFARHGGASRQAPQLAQATADMPAPGASPAALETGAGGFAVPGGSGRMSGQTFDQVTAGLNGQPQAPAFHGQGVSQPWMGSAIAALGKGRTGSAASGETLPPARPYDLNADLPAQGAVQAMGRPPIDRAGAIDIDPNSPDGGSRAYAATQGVIQEPEAATTREADTPARGAAQAQGELPSAVSPNGAPAVLSREMPRPTTRDGVRDFHYTRQMEGARGKVRAIADALANPNLPANARAVGEIFLKEALENSKAPDSVKEYMFAKHMGWTNAKSPAEYAKEKTKVSPVEETEGRKAAAAAAGLKPGDAGYQSFILTGKMPREDMGPLTATDKKAIMEAEEMVMVNQTAIDNLRQAKDLSAKAYEGPTAGMRGMVMGNLGNEAGKATMEYSNLVTANALTQLKSIFGAAPTEGERKILLEIQGSASLPHDVRVKILDRAIAMAEQRMNFNRQRAAELRSGSYYKPGGGGGPPQADQRARAQPSQNLPQGSRQAPDGNWYVPDPSRPGKFLQVQ